MSQFNTVRRVTWNLPPIVVQIAGMYLFGIMVKHDDEEGLKKIMDAVEANNSTPLVEMLATWEHLGYWASDMQAQSPVRQEAEEAGIDEKDVEECMVCAAVGTFVQEHGGVIGVVRSMHALQEIHVHMTNESIGYNPNTTHTTHYLGRSEDGKHIVGHAYANANEDFVKSLEADGTDFLEIWNLDELEKADLPEPVKEMGRSLLSMPEPKLPLRVGKVPSKIAESMGAVPIKATKPEPSKIN